MQITKRIYLAWISNARIYVIFDRHITPENRNIPAGVVFVKWMVDVQSRYKK